MSDKMTELFKRYKETGDVSIRNEIVEHYLYIADILAKKFVGRGVEYDDLRQIAVYELILGVDKYDPDFGTQFTTFITPTITGKIKNYFRDKSRMVKVPRKLSEISVSVKKFSSEYETEHGEKPSVKVIATTMGFSEEDVVKALEIGGTLSLDGMEADADGEEKSLYALIGDGEEKYEAFETKETLRSAMQDFSDTEKTVVKLRFVDELSQSETANRLGVSQMFVSRMERKILAKLKERLKDAF